MQCEKCGSEMCDNRINKRNPKWPDYKCKNQECGHATWLPKKPQYAQRPAQGRQEPIATKPAMNGDTQRHIIRQNALSHATAIVLNRYGKDETLSETEMAGLACVAAEILENWVMRPVSKTIPRVDTTIANEEPEPIQDF